MFTKHDAIEDGVVDALPLKERVGGYGLLVALLVVAAFKIFEDTRPVNEVIMVDGGTMCHHRGESPEKLLPCNDISFKGHRIVRMEDGHEAGGPGGG